MSRRQVRRIAFEFDHRQVFALRDALGLTQERLAREVDVSLRTVQRWEYGDSAPNRNQLLRLAAVLQVHPDDLYLEEAPAA